MSTLIDTHTHIDMPEFEADIEDVIQRAKDAGLEKIIIPSANRDSFDGVIKMSEKYDGFIYCALGVHPTEFDVIKEEDFERIIELSSNKKVVAIGECGLDYYWEKSEEKIKIQQELFLRQIKIAKDLKKPLIVHDREAHKDSFDLITQNIKDEAPVIMHCFSGSVEFAKECLKKGFYIGLGGVITFKNAKKMREVAKIVPLDRLVVETDAPYLTPEPFRGKRNEPAFVKYSAEKIAQIKEIPFDELADITTHNAKYIFGI